MSVGLCSDLCCNVALRLLHGLAAAASVRPSLHLRIGSVCACNSDSVRCICLADQLSLVW